MDEAKATGQSFASLLPMLILMFLFSGAMSIGPDSIAGEKERGTIATLLVTPIRRRDVAIGKVLSLSIVALMSAASSFVGILLSLPKLMQGENLNTNIYGFGDYVAILVVLLATVLFIVGIVSVVSAYAKSIKEASMLVLPLYFIAIIIGVTTMFNNGDTMTNPLLYAIPLYNSVHMLIGILTFEIDMMNFAIMVASNLVYVVVLVFVMNKLFESERVMFSK
jgi:sodium transport system permease protein